MLVSLLVMHTVLANDGSTGPTIQLQGKSGKFSVCPTGSCSERSIGVQVDFVREMSEGKKVPKHFTENMASQEFNVGDPKGVMMGAPAVNASKYPFSAKISVGSGATAKDATLNFDTFFFKQPTTISSNNLTIEILKDALKFDVTVSDWNFATASNTLEVGIKLTTVGAKTGGSLTDVDTKGGQKAKALDFGNMYFDAPLVATYDGTEKPVALSSSSSGSKSTVITIGFESFTSSVVYDPTIGGNGNGCAGLQPGMLLITATLVASSAIAWSAFL